MLAIQEGAQQILSDNPGTLYFLTGPEYGVKAQYIVALKEHYANECIEHDSLDELIQSLSKKSIIPRKPTLYVVRYDQDFLRTLDAGKATKLKSLNPTGTIVGIYSDDKSETKLDKHFSEYTIRINLLPPQVQKKHLLREFSNFPERILDTVIKISRDFYQATLLCRTLSCLPETELAGLTSNDIVDLFGYKANSNVSTFKCAVAARDYKTLIREIEAYTDDYSLLFYDMLSTYLEIAKMLGRSYGDSYVSPYLKLWDYPSLKTMYDITYEQIEKLRNVSSYSSRIAITYTCSLLQFKLR